MKVVRIVLAVFILSIACYTAKAAERVPAQAVRAVTTCFYVGLIGLSIQWWASLPAGHSEAVLYQGGVVAGTAFLSGYLAEPIENNNFDVVAAITRGMKRISPVFIYYGSIRAFQVIGKYLES